MAILEILCGKQPFWKESPKRRFPNLEARLSQAINTASGPNYHKTPASIYPANGEVPDDYGLDPCCNGGGGANVCASPQLREFSASQNGGALPAFVLSDTPRQGFKWIIDNMSFYDTGTGIGALCVFLLAPGYSYNGVADPFGANVPGTIKLGVGRVIDGGTPTMDFSIINSSVWEGSVQNWLPGYELQNNWKIGVSEMQPTGLSRTIALRLLYREVESCGQNTPPLIPKYRYPGHGQLTYSGPPPTGSVGSKAQ